ncbi:hypothetical protein QTP88_014712 [Uroleucon formosanum]
MGKNNNCEIFYKCLANKLEYTTLPACSYVPVRIKSYYTYHVDKSTVAIILYQVLTYFKLTNSVNFIAIVIVFGGLLKGNTNRVMPYALILTAIGCVFDIFSVLLRTTDDDGSSWAHVKFFYFIMRIFKKNVWNVDENPLYRDHPVRAPLHIDAILLLAAFNGCGSKKTNKTSIGLI